MRTPALAVAAVVALGSLVAATACGSDAADPKPVSSRGRPYARALVTSFVTEQPGELRLTRTEASCLAAAWVEVLKPVRLAEEGVQPADLDDGSHRAEELADLGLTVDEADQLVDGFDRCRIDLEAVYLETLAPAGGELGDDERACLEDAFDDEFLERAYAVLLRQGAGGVDDDPELSGELFAAFNACPGLDDAGG